MEPVYTLSAKCASCGKTTYDICDWSAPAFSDDQDPYGPFTCAHCGSLQTWTKQTAEIHSTAR